MNGNCIASQVTKNKLDFVFCFFWYKFYNLQTKTHTQYIVECFTKKNIIIFKNRKLLKTFWKNKKNIFFTQFFFLFFSLGVEANFSPF